MSNTDSGCGKSYFARLSYKPVPGDLKSGIPAAEKEIILISRALAKRGLTLYQIKKFKTGLI